MSSHTRPTLTALEVMGFMALLPLLLSKIIAFTVTSSLLQWKEGNFSRRELKRNAAASCGTAAITIMSLRQIRALVKQTTGEIIEKYCVAHKLSHLTALVVNDDGFPPATLHFVGCELDQKGPIFLYFHGGGYLAPLQSAAYASSLAHAARASLVLLEYTLAPACVYPGQLAQATAALRLLLQHRSAADIILAGESAGGNMVLAVLAHLQQPKPGISPLELSSTTMSRNNCKFRGVVAISPRTANEAAAESFWYNHGRDNMNRKCLRVITETWRPRNDVWAAPVLAKAGFWDGMRTERVLLVVGGSEVYLDDVRRVAHAMGAAKVGGQTVIQGSSVKAEDSALQLVVCPGEMHCQASLDQSLGIRDGHMTREVAQWLSRL